MKIHLLILFLISSLHAFVQTDLNLSKEQLNRLLSLPVKCLNVEYPNKLNQVITSDEDLLSPDELHPIFYGCFDWHSSVHGHWLIAAILNRDEELSNKDSLYFILDRQFTTEKVSKEIAYFNSNKYNASFERTYGWAWLLKLQMELDQSGQAQLLKYGQTLRPLSDLIVEKYKEYLPKLNYPIRNGEHINTAFGLCFAWDYALQSKDTSFQTLIRDKAFSFFRLDNNYPLYLEPSGYDFISPALMEADLMRRLMPEKEYISWLKKFLPELSKKNFKLKPGVVSDRSDGKLVHLDGLNFSRAWCLYQISMISDKYAHLRKVADEHMAFSLPSIVDGDYMGEHWLASFAFYALQCAENKSDH
jgi:hypothetical protein